MFGPRITTVFRSRWRALWFVASVLVGVYFSVPSADDKPDPDAQKELAVVSSLIGADQPAPAHQHVNPWSKTPP